MAADDQAVTDVRPPTDNPRGYWTVKIITVLLIAALAAFDLTTEEAIPIVVYAALASLAGGPELLGLLRGGK